MRPKTRDWMEWDELTRVNVGWVCNRPWRGTSSVRRCPVDWVDWSRGDDVIAIQSLRPVSSESPPAWQSDAYWWGTSVTSLRRGMSTRSLRWGVSITSLTGESVCSGTAGGRRTLSSKLSVVVALDDDPDVEDDFKLPDWNTIINTTTRHTQCC